MPYATDRLPWSLRGTDGLMAAADTAPNAWAAGYAIGKVAEEGDQLPHPTWFRDNPEMFWHAERAALAPRGLDVSLFGVCIRLAQRPARVVR